MTVPEVSNFDLRALSVFAATNLVRLRLTQGLNDLTYFVVILQLFIMLPSDPGPFRKFVLRTRRIHLVFQF